MKMLTYSDLAKLLGLSTEALRMRISRNPEQYPPSIKLGTRTVRFEEGTVERWVKAKNAKGEKLFP
jgi:predicted DNA-binding transcriptional regulator AlpA